jgi:hypothetical protein
MHWPPQGHNAAGRTTSIEKIHLIRTLSHDLPHGHTIFITVLKMQGKVIYVFMNLVFIFVEYSYLSYRRV